MHLEYYIPVRLKITLYDKEQCLPGYRRLTQRLSAHYLFWTETW
ncbi:hypothetical protein MHIR_DE00315 [Candidatus Doolittlea endobia]|uniref:Uncharacterized protein n=1 Tax=Candidatus Doolittlea endobia TaxID=1778262 RepID=A0A143WS68_9ENTR|nr:hypothetical protein MHIR_DE00315 [Candidatus Doolittlea endobia]